MLQFIRARSQMLLWILVLVVVVAFSLWGPSLSFRGTNNLTDVARIDGKTISLDQFRNAVREIYCYLSIHSSKPIEENDELNQFLSNQAWQRLLTLHESERMNISVSDKEVLSEITKMEIFSDTNGFYNTQKYDTFIREELPRYGMDEAGFHHLLRNHILAERTRRLLGAGAQVSESEVNNYAERLNGKVTLQVIELDKNNFQGTNLPTEAELRRAYEMSPEKYRSPEERKIKYIRFSLDSAKTNRLGTNYTAAVEELGKQAFQFTVDLLGEEGKPKTSFEALAGTRNLKVEETGFFTPETLPANFSNKWDALRAIFTVTEQQPDSDVVREGNEFFVFHLDQSKPSEPLPFEKVRQKILAEFAEKRALDNLNNIAVNLYKKIVESFRDGKTFEQIIAELRLPVRKIEPFIPQEEEEKQEDSKILPLFQNAAVQLGVGEISPPFASEKGAVICYVLNREKPVMQPEAMEKLRLEMIEQKRQLLYREWLNLAQRAPGTEILTRGDQSQN